MSGCARKSGWARAGCMPAMIAFVLAAAHSSAGVTRVDPFMGSLSDPLNYPGTTIVSSFNIFAGVGRLRSFDDATTSIHYLLQDQFAGDLVTPRTGGRVLGFTTGPAYFEFAAPMQRFGAWWENNSGADDATVEFFDANGGLIATDTAFTVAAAQAWTWNGWESTVGIASIRVTGNGIIDGFLWFDDFEGDLIPAPATVGVLLVGLLAKRRRHT